MHGPDVATARAPGLAAGAEQPTRQIDAEDSASILRSSLSLQDHKSRGEPYALRGWPLKPQRLNGSIQSKRLNSLGDAFLVIFPALSLGTYTYSLGV